MNQSLAPVTRESVVEKTASACSALVIFSRFVSAPGTSYTSVVFSNLVFCVGGDLVAEVRLFIPYFLLVSVHFIDLYMKTRLSANCDLKCEILTESCSHLECTFLLFLAITAFTLLYSLAEKHRYRITHGNRSTKDKPPN